MIFINQIQYWIGKVFLGDRYLTIGSISGDELRIMLCGKSVAIVGNARSLGALSHGPEIDSFDVVIRLNDAPIPSEESHGTRTDWLAVAKTINLATLKRKDPKIVLWMPTKRTRLKYHMFAYAQFYLNPLARNSLLRGKLGAPPSLGYMMIDLLEQSEAQSVRLFGFDFFFSKSFSGNRSASQVPHDFKAEEAAVSDLIHRDPRFTLADAST